MDNPKNYTCIAIDDDKLFLRKLEAIVSEIEWLEMTQTFSEPGKAIDSLTDHQPDIIFLDIEMPFIDGYRVLEYLLPHIESAEKKPKIVILTGSIEMINYRNPAVNLTLFKRDVNTPEDLEISLWSTLN